MFLFVVDLAVMYYINFGLFTGLILVLGFLDFLVLVFDLPVTFVLGC